MPNWKVNVEFEDLCNGENLETKEDVAAMFNEIGEDFNLEIIVIEVEKVQDIDKV